MPCGCKQGRWAPKAVNASGTVGTPRGPHAPGYAAPSKSAPPAGKVTAPAK